MSQGSSGHGFRGMFALRHGDTPGIFSSRPRKLSLLEEALLYAL